MAKRNLQVRDQNKKVRCALVLLRHGQSRYNLEKVFTGWADPDLTNRGRDEARLAGRLLKAVGINKIEVLYTSLLQRAVKTAWLALDEMDLQWTTIKHTWRLNERNYGALQGLVKSECAERHGLKQVQKWRRGYSDRPPPWDETVRREMLDRRYDTTDELSERWAAMRDDVVTRSRLGGGGSSSEGSSEYVELPFPPDTESLRDCTARTLPFLYGELQPAMERAVAKARAACDEGGGEYEVPTVLVVASENVLRGLVMYLEELQVDEIPLVDVPYAVPLVYQLDEQLQPIATPWAERPLRSGWYLGDPAKVKAVQAEIKADLPTSNAGPGEESDSCLVVVGEDGEENWVCE